MWLTSTNPDALLNVVQPPVWPAPPTPPATSRRLGLFGCACARMVWAFLPTDTRNAVLIRERYAEGRAGEADLRVSVLQPRWGQVTYHQQAQNAAAMSAPRDAARHAAKALATRTAGPAPPGGNPVAPGWQAAWNGAYWAARAHQCELLRDIFPPPGYTLALRPEWRTSTVIALARQMDETGDFSAVPILADALQDAGCDSDTILTRCRAESGIHCRGNWVVDLVLGRE